MWAAWGVAFELPGHMRHAYAEAYLPKGCKFLHQHAFAKRPGVDPGVLVLDFRTTLPPHPAHVDKICIDSEAGCEACHIVGVPRFLYFTHQRQDVFLVHGLGA